MRCVAAVPSLKSLVLGFTRVQDAGLATLTALQGLTHLALTAEAITSEGLLVCPTPTVALMNCICD